MNKQTINNNNINFNNIDKEVFVFVCSLGISMLVEMLEKIDDSLFANRDKREYRYKFKNEKTIQTVMGDLKIKRRYYIKRSTKQGVYLLDEALAQCHQAKM